MKKIIPLVIGLGVVAVTGMSAANYYGAEPFASVIEVVDPPRTYQEILAEGALPGIDPSYDFPSSYQYLNGCVAFAVNHVLIYKYGQGLDLLEVERVVEKPREMLWSKEYVQKFYDSYGIESQNYRDAETLFGFLVEGEPVTISYQYPLDDGDYVVHRVAAYSFDDQGIWVSDSLKGGAVRLDYGQVFDDGGRYTRYYFASVERGPSNRGKDSENRG